VKLQQVKPVIIQNKATVSQKGGILIYFNLPHENSIFLLIKTTELKFYSTTKANSKELAFFEFTFFLNRYIFGEFTNFYGRKGKMIFNFR